MPVFETLPHADSGSADRMILVDELNHRVLNEYTQIIASISLAATRTVNLDARSALTDAASMLRAFAEVHRALQSPATTEEADLGEYLARLCAAFSRARLHDRGVRLLLVQNSLPMAADRCWRVGLIVAELITNSARHGFKDGGGVIIVDIATVGRRSLLPSHRQRRLGPGSVARARTPGDRGTGRPTGGVRSGGALRSPGLRRSLHFRCAPGSRHRPRLARRQTKGRFRSSESAFDAPIVSPWRGPRRLGVPSLQRERDQSLLNGD